MIENLHTIIDNFKTLKVLVIGDVMIDSYIRGSIDRISPEAPVPVVRVSNREKRLGGAANVALNVKSLGAEAVLCSVIGDDRDGEILKNLLITENLSTQGIIESDFRPTTVKNRVMSGHHHVVRIDEESDKLLSSTEYANLINIIEKLIDSTDIVIFEDYDKGVISEELINFVKQLCKERSISIVADPKKRNFQFYKDISILKPNLIELNQFQSKQLDGKNINEIEDAVNELINTTNCDGVMVTLGDQGVYINYKTQKHYIKAHYRDVSDVSGAGDTVISVMALCLALGLPPRQIAEYSNLAGGIVCEHQGVVPITVDMLIAETGK